jgi:hypothetical protein
MTSGSGVRAQRRLLGYVGPVLAVVAVLAGRVVT